jgi:pimeloyl-ACP methyl ester carboxylesterase
MRRRTFLEACAAASVLAELPMNAGASESESESEYDLVTPTGTIFGTATVPAARGPLPVVLIVAGSGPVDRNGNGPMLALNMYLKLATALAAHGIASVRYDKRGMAASHAAMSAEADLRFDTYVDDAAAWIAKIRGDARFSRVVFAGHSEGSLIGAVAARRAPVDAFVSIEGAGFPASDVLSRQLAAQLQGSPAVLAQVRTILSALAAGRTVAAADIPPSLMSLFRPSIQPYLISWFKYDPRAEIAQVKAPVVIVQGTHDVQIPVEDGRALAQACPSADFVLIDGLTHVLTDDPGTTIAQQVTSAYADAERPLDDVLVRTLVAAAQPR